MNYPPGVTGSEPEIVGCECDDDFICQECAHGYLARLEKAVEPGSDEAEWLALILEDHYLKQMAEPGKSLVIKPIIAKLRGEDAKEES